MKLTKTETSILQRLQGREVVALESGYWRGPQGGRGTFGRREFDAARRLIERGLARKVAFEASGFTTANGTYVRSCLLRIELVPQDSLAT